MNRASLARFAARSAAQRTALFGVEFQLGALRFCAALNAVTTSRDLESGGWLPTVGATLRVARCELQRAGITGFELGAVLIRGTSASYRIEEIRDNPSAPELVLGLAYDHSG
jgi:hypothetical protein